MARYAVIDNGVVVGVLGASTPPTIDIPVSRIYVDIQDLPAVRGGEFYDPATGIFSLAPTVLDQRLATLESDVKALQEKTSKLPVPPVTVTPEI